MPNVNDHFCCIISDVVRSGDGQIFDSLLELHLVNILYETLRTTDQNCQAIKYNIYYLITEVCSHSRRGILAHSDLGEARNGNPRLPQVIER